MSISNYAENKILDHVLCVSAFTTGSAVWVALHSADPGETGASEIVGGSYARQSAAFGASSSGQNTTTATLNFTGMPAVTVSHLSLWDTNAAGNCLWTGSLSAPKTVGAGDTLTINTGDLDVSLD